MDIRKELEALKDEKYRSFQSGLIPGLPKESFLGVRTPALRGLAVKLIKAAKQTPFWRNCRTGCSMKTSCMH